MTRRVHLNNVLALKEVWLQNTCLLMQSHTFQRIGIAFLTLLGLAFLSGCETMQAMGSGEVYGKPKASNYSYGLPDRYRAGVPSRTSNASASQAQE